MHSAVIGLNLDDAEKYRCLSDELRVHAQAQKLTKEVNICTMVTSANHDLLLSKADQASTRHS